MNLRYQHTLNMQTNGTAFSGQACSEIRSDIRVNSPKTKWLNLS
jgi:hypothetical protein